VTLDDCAAISREVGDLLDIHGIPDGPYTLEVSSPGLDRPLVKDGDFLKYVGHRVKVTTREKVEGVRHFRGCLMDFVDDQGRKILVLHVDGRTYRVPREIVLKANLEYEV
jgi:ribosome maturation factor RimP